MLPKKNRADKKTLAGVFKEGKFINTPSFSLKFILKNTPTEPRVSVVVPKSIARLATQRNLLRRVGYQALYPHLSSLPRGLAGALIFKVFEDDFRKIQKDVAAIVHKIN